MLAFDNNNSNNNTSNNNVLQVCTGLRLIIKVYNTNNDNIVVVISAVHSSA